MPYYSDPRKRFAYGRHAAASANSAPWATPDNTAPSSGAIATAQAGNWSSASTWTGGVVPRNGNTVVIDHNVTIDAHATIGSSPTSAAFTGTPGVTAAITIASGKTLTIGAGVYLFCRGDIDNGGVLALSAGANLKFDSSQASAPTTTHYVLDSWNAAYTVSLQVNGSIGSRCTIGSYNTSYWRLTGGERHDGTSNPQAFRGIMQAIYCDFSRMGDASNNAWTFQGDIGGTTDTQVSATNCTFDLCGQIKPLLSMYGRVGMDFVNCTWTNSAGPYCFRQSGDAFLGASTRRVQGCVFDIPTRWDNGKTFTIADNVFLNGYELYDFTGTVSGSLLSATSITSVPMPWGSSFEDNYFAHNGTTDLNPHFLDVGAGTGAVGVTGNVFEYLKSDYQGDIIILGAAGSGTSLTNVATITNNIALPNAAGASSGCLINSLNGDNYKIDAKNNTAFIGSIEGGFTSGETGTANTAGLWNRITNNIFWDTSARGYKFKDIAADGSASDLVAAADADYNVGYNFLAGSNGNGYNQLEFSSGTPGAHDISVDPQFVDSARDLAKWDLSLGGPGTAANALAEMAKRNLSTFNASYTLANLRAYVRAGFQPLNTALAGAGDTRDSSPDIGAVAVDTTPAAPVNVSAPSISGSATVGGTLTANEGLWTGYPRPTYARQWKADGSNISEATGTTYSPVSGDAGKTITVTTTATNTQGSAFATSAGVGPVISTGLTYTATQSSLYNEFGGLTSATITDVAIGAAGADRRVIVQLNGIANPTSITIGGVAATVDAIVSGYALVASAIVPTGTTADIAITSGDTFSINRVVCHAGTVYGTNATTPVFTSGTAAFSSGDCSVGPLTVPTGGVGVVALYCATAAATLGGVTTDASFTNPENQFLIGGRFGHATSTFTAAGDTTQGNGSAMAAAVFQP